MCAAPVLLAGSVSGVGTGVVEPELPGKIEGSAQPQIALDRHRLRSDAEGLRMEDAGVAGSLLGAARLARPGCRRYLPEKAAR